MLELLLTRLLLVRLLFDAVDETLLRGCALELLWRDWLDWLACIRLDSDWLDAILETMDDRLLNSLLLEEIGALLLDWLESFPDAPPPHAFNVREKMINSKQIG